MSRTRWRKVLVLGRDLSVGDVYRCDPDVHGYGWQRVTERETFTSGQTRFRSVPEHETGAATPVEVDFWPVENERVEVLERITVRRYR